MAIPFFSLPPAGAEVPGRAATLTAQQEKDRAILCHLLPLLAYLGLAFGPVLGSYGPLVFPVGYLLGPAIVWLIDRRQSKYLNEVGKEVISFKISLLLWLLIALALFYAVIGIALLGALLLFDVVITFVAVSAASNGQQFRYPLTIRFTS